MEKEAELAGDGADPTPDHEHQCDVHVDHHGSPLFRSRFRRTGAVKAIKSIFLGDWGLTPWQVIWLMMISFIILGMFLDDTAMLVIVAPLYIPLVGELGFDLVWFGVLYAITCQIAYITPPFGYNLFLMRAMAPKEFTLGDIYRSIVPFALILTQLPPIRTFTWQLPQPTNEVLRHAGIILFLSAVALSAGEAWDRIGEPSVWIPILWMALLTTLLPLALGAFVAIRIFKIPSLQASGLLAGSMTDPPALGFLNQLAPGNMAAPLAFTSVYPVTMIARVLLAQILALLLF